MALFFDREWFDAKLAASHLSQADIARALGIGDVQIAEIWKDQRELSAKDVTILAALLAVSAEDIALHAGISTPIPKSQPTLAELAQRLARVEAELAQIKTQLREGHRS
ncbi:MAG TPA: helix-turn-helix domain-containing protein [Rhizomicrobium sp.]